METYERAWRTAGADGLREIFTDDASYRMSPYEEPLRGLEAIAVMWERERQGPDEDFTLKSEVIAVDGHTAVARVDVRYGAPRQSEYRDLWVIEFAPDGRCRAFEEWPFFPGQARSALP